MKIGISISLCTGLVVQGVGPMQTPIISAKASFGWIENSPAIITSINEDDYSNAGVEVASFLTGKVSDPASTGIAVVALDNTKGPGSITTRWEEFGIISSRCRTVMLFCC